jgi:hypothetical protein
MRTDFAWARRAVACSAVGLGLTTGVWAQSEWKAPPEVRGLTNPVRDTGNAPSLVEANCLPCHGEHGRGDGPAAVALPPPKPADWTSEDLFEPDDALPIDHEVGPPGVPGRRVEHAIALGRLSRLVAQQGEGEPKDLLDPAEGGWSIHGDREDLRARLAELRVPVPARDEVSVAHLEDVPRLELHEDDARPCEVAQPDGPRGRVQEGEAGRDLADVDDGIWLRGDGPAITEEAEREEDR